MKAAVPNNDRIERLRAGVKSGVAMSVRPIMTEHVNCDLCGSDDQVLLYTKTDPVTREEFHLVECRCGMAFVNPMPTEESVPDLYPEDYLKDKGATEDLYHGMLKFLPERTGGRLLDIGCGRGDFIDHASRRGWDAEGVDLMAWETPHRVPIRVGNFFAMDFQERSYDVITAWAVLEHARRPSSFFRKVAGLLKEDGCFVFVVPNFEAPGMRISCTEDVPRHLNLFSRRATDAYLNKFGMEAKAVFHSDAIYTSYPFGLVRHLLYRARAEEKRCSRYENKSVKLLRNRQVKGNLRDWLIEVKNTLGPLDIAVDAVDLAVGVVVSSISKMIGNYGVMTVVAGLRAKKKQSNEEDC